MASIIVQNNMYEALIIHTNITHINKIIYISALTWRPRTWASEILSA